LRELLGYSLLNIDALRPEMTVQVDDEDVMIWAESYDPVDSTVMFTYDDGPLQGQAAVVRKGRAFSIGAFSPILIGRVLAHVLTEAGIRVTPLDDGLRVSHRGSYTIWLNFNPDDRRLPDGRSMGPVSFLID
jgi:beta-galactosidase